MRALSNNRSDHPFFILVLSEAVLVLVLEWDIMTERSSITRNSMYIAFRIARGSALECVAIHDILVSIVVIDEDSNRLGKSQLRRIISMLTRLIQRTEHVPTPLSSTSTSTSTAMLSTSRRERPTCLQP